MLHAGTGKESGALQTIRVKDDMNEGRGWVSEFEDASPALCFPFRDDSIADLVPMSNARADPPSYLDVTSAYRFVRITALQGSSPTAVRARLAGWENRQRPGRARSAEGHVLWKVDSGMALIEASGCFQCLRVVVAHIQALQLNYPLAPDLSHRQVLALDNQLTVKDHV